MYTFWTEMEHGLRGLKEVVYVKCEKSTLNQGGGLGFHPSNTHDVAVDLLPRQFHSHLHLDSCDQDQEQDLQATKDSNDPQE